MSSRSRRHRQQTTRKGRVMRMSEQNTSAMDGIIRRGPVTIILVFSTSCPHCHTYMPIWNKLCKTQGRRANMISMEASTYQQTPLSAKKPVSGVPTVLYVTKQGEIIEIEKPRDTSVMQSVIRNIGSTNVLSPSPGPSVSSSPGPSVSSSPSPSVSSSPGPSPSPSMTPSPSVSSSPSMTVKPPFRAALQKGLSQRNSLKAIPAVGGSRRNHRGGNWNALLAAAQQAAPAAALLGAYAAFPMQRSSGLGAPRTRKRK